MDSWRYNHSFSLLHLLRVTAKCGHSQQVYIVSSQGLAQHSSFEAHSFARVTLELIQVPLEIRVGVGVAVCKVNRVVVILELDVEGKCVIVPRRLPLHWILVVTDILARTRPASAKFLGFNLRIHQWSHPVVIEAVGLQKVYNVKPIEPPCPCILDSEVIPLSVSSSIVIRLQDNIVFKFVDLYGST